MGGRPIPGCFILGFINSSPVHLVIVIDKDFDRIMKVQRKTKC